MYTNYQDILDDLHFSDDEPSKNYPEENPELFDRRLPKIINIILEGRDTQFIDSFKIFFTEVIKDFGFLTAPASTKYHLNRKFGLLEHSLNVAETALKLYEVHKDSMPNVFRSSVAFCGLFHDFGKAGNPHDPLYIEKSGGVAGYQYNTKLYPFMFIPHRSLYYLTWHFKLTPEEFQAILIHDGQYVNANKEYACKECPLALLLQHADQWSGFIIENKA